MQTSQYSLVNQEGAAESSTFCETMKTETNICQTEPILISEQSTRGPSLSSSKSLTSNLSPVTSPLPGQTLGQKMDTSPMDSKTFNPPGDVLQSSTPLQSYTQASQYLSLNNSILILNRYCAKLPSDTFTRLTPTWTVQR